MSSNAFNIIQNNGYIKQIKKSIDSDYNQLEEFYAELKEKLISLMTINNFDEDTKYFLTKIFKLDNEEDSTHFNIITFIEKIKDFCDVS